ncbi:MAG: M28 family peptidase [Candidatus Marithrix sp.]
MIIILQYWLIEEFQNMGFEASCQGKYDNVLATYNSPLSKCKIILGAHYDSVPESPGADDNASAIAGLLATAKILKQTTSLPVLFVVFNREEDGLLGSSELANILSHSNQFSCIHILEMIGYCSNEKGSQQVPPGLPIKISDIGNFITIISNHNSNQFVKPIIQIGEDFVPSLPIKALKVFFGTEKYFPHLLRSDYAPFWDKNMPAIMWTDTSEFRNPNYHKSTDTPDTIDYKFLKNVTELLARVIYSQII